MAFLPVAAVARRVKVANEYNLSNLDKMSQDEIKAWFEKALPETRTDGFSFKECLEEILRDAGGVLKEIKAQFDRLYGTNVSFKGSPIITSIDMASGRFETDSLKFFYFLHETVFLRHNFKEDC